MNFELNEEQRALRDSLERLLEQRYGFEQRRAHEENAAGHDPATWDKLAELGILGLPIAQEHGGFGGGARDLLPALQALGGALSLEPVLPVVLAATALGLGADEPLRREVLPEVAAGGRVVWAHEEPATRHAALWVETRAERRGEGWVLHGVKAPVPGAGLADRFVVSARVDGPPHAQQGLALFLLSASAPRLAVRPFRFVDGTVAGELTLSGVAARPLADPDDGARAKAAIDATVAMGIAAACADMAGASEAAFRLAMDYLNTRRQFGRLIGENQALRHRAAEMLVSLEMARSMAIAAAVAVDRPADEASALDLHRAKLSVGRHARAVAHGAIQLHGGIGMTEEYAVGHYLRRIHVLDQRFGDGESHAARLAERIPA